MSRGVWIVFRAAPFALGRQVVVVYDDEHRETALKLAGTHLWLVAEHFPLTDPASKVEL
jgi:hypothetical protein